MSHGVRAGAATRPWRCEMSGFTVVPRWTLNPVPGIGEHEVWIPAELTAASQRLANDSALPVSSVLLTAHAKVLGALSGEHEVCTGYAVDARSEEHTSELQSHSDLVCRLLLEKKKKKKLKK